MTLQHPISLLSVVKSSAGKVQHEREKYNLLCWLLTFAILIVLTLTSSCVTTPSWISLSEYLSKTGDVCFILRYIRG
jgi:hypothetical protein